MWTRSRETLLYPVIASCALWVACAEGQSSDSPEAESVDGGLSDFPVRPGRPDLEPRGDAIGVDGARYDAVTDGADEPPATDARDASPADATDFDRAPPDTRDGRDASDADATEAADASDLSSCEPADACPSNLFLRFDFEDDDGGWTTEGAASSWEWGVPSATFISAAGEGASAWVTNLDGDYNPNEISALVSPRLDLRGLSGDPVMRFLHTRNLEVFDGVWVEISLDGATWTKLGSASSGRNWYSDAGDDWWSGDGEGWVASEHILTGAAGHARVRVRLVLESDSSVELEGFGVDDVTFSGGTIDGGVEAIDVTSEGCGLRADNAVVATVANLGTEPFGGVDLTLLRDGVEVATESYVGPIVGGERDEYAFEATVDLTAGGHEITVSIAVPGDVDSGNDALTVDVSELGGFTGLPYTEDFETGDGDWIAYGTSSTWATGAPSAGIPTPPTGTTVWATNPSGPYTNNESSFVESPCIDLSELEGDPTMVFQHFYATETCCDEGWLEMSVDGGSTWRKVLADPRARNWYNDTISQWWEGDSLVWRAASVRLTGAAGHGDVRIRFAFSSDFSITDAGFAFDDVFIGEVRDAAVERVALVDPLAGRCELGPSESVVATVRNEGSATIEGATIELAVDGAVLATETLPAIAPDAALEHTFAATVDLEATGVYEIEVTVSLPDDSFPANDTGSLTVESLGDGTVLPYTEGFEAGAGGWFSYGTSNSWARGRPAAGIGGTPDGDFAWVTNPTGTYNNNESSYVESPCLDFSSAEGDGIFTFQHWFDTESCCDEGWLELSTDGGATWRKVLAGAVAQNWYNDTVSQWWEGSSGGWRQARVTLPGTAGVADVRLRFAFSSDLSVLRDGFAIDQLFISGDAIHDVSLGRLDIVDRGCRFGSSEHLVVAYRNEGTAPLTDVELEVWLDGELVFTEAMTRTIAVGESSEYALETPLDLSATGAHEIEVVATHPDEATPANNTTSLSIRSGFPYLEDFEAGDGRWFTYGTNNTWARGRPTATVISGASSGDFAWVTNPSGLYNNLENSYVESRCWDFSLSTSDPRIRFRHIFDTETNFDEGWLEMSVNGGTTWSKVLASADALNWYNDTGNQWWESGSGGWRTAETDLAGAAGQSDVRVRFVFSSDGSVLREGFAFDDVELLGVDVVEIEVSDVGLESNRCQPGASETVYADFRNNGTVAVTGLEALLAIDDAAVATESVATIAPGETVRHSFSAPVDLSAAGSYQLRVHHNAESDVEVSNDSRTVEVVHEGRTALPYDESFESGEAGWTTYGESSTWARGIPSGAVIASAADGDWAWVTNPAGSYGSEESSFLESPCFDFSTLSGDPVLRFQQQLDTEACCDHGWLEYSLDSGASWITLVDTGGASGWYEDTLNQWWEGSSSGWRSASVILDRFAGEPNVRFRFAFVSDFSLSLDGMAFDAVELFEE